MFLKNKTFLRNLGCHRNFRLWDSGRAFLTVFSSRADFHPSRRMSSEGTDSPSTNTESSKADDNQQSWTDSLTLDKSSATTPEEELRLRELQVLSLAFLEKVEENKLNPQQLAIHRAHVNALKTGMKFYTDPVSGYQVMTRLAHLDRGECCGNACRHCPFGHRNAPDELQGTYNSAFYQ